MNFNKFIFYKYTGCGNDFVLIDNRSLTFPTANRLFINKLCDRYQGIGADGLVLLQNSQSADFKMRIFNKDGSEAEMCGNGLRCLSRFIHYLQLASNHFCIETNSGILEVSLQADEVLVEFGAPKDIQWNITVPLAQSTLTLHLLNVGVPHAILFVNQVDNFNIEDLGKAIRYHPLFKPEGVNANFVSICDNGQINNRTYERGVEGETQACGTGATAAALAAAKLFSLPSPIKVNTLSSETLTVFFDFMDDRFTNVRMSGTAKMIYKGEFEPTQFLSESDALSYILK